MSNQVTPNVLASRYATKEMVEIFNPINKIIEERKFWITVLKLQQKAGLPITEADISSYEKGENTMPLEFGENNIFIGKFKGEFVLQYRPNDNVKPKSKFIANGKITDKNKLVDFLPTESHATNQGTEREILWRKLYLKNIRKLTLNGQTYKVISYESYDNRNKGTEISVPFFYPII